MNNQSEQNKEISAEEIVEENFKGLSALIDDEDNLYFYKQLIVTCMEEYRNLPKEPVQQSDAIEFADWMNEVFETYSNGATIRRCMSQKPDHKLYALFDKKEGLVGKGHQYFTLTELYKLYLQFKTIIK